MKYELEITVCDESQGVEIGESFADCVSKLFATIHAVPEQFTPDYVTEILNCIYVLSMRVNAEDVESDLDWEMDGELFACALAGDDSITASFRQSAE